MEEHLPNLKLKLQSLGAIRQQAWHAIAAHLGSVSLKPGESFIRREGTLAYISEGLLKEYDASERLTPSVINFLSEGSPIITRKHNTRHYLKATMPTQLFYWTRESLASLYQQFAELQPIYETLCEQYDSSIAFRQLVLEEKVATRKISLFIQRNRAILPLLKKKDIANYLHLDYDYFVRNYHRLL